MDVPALIAGRYELGPLIGRGGMGEVYRAYDRQQQLPVALKTLRRDLATPTLLERLKREGEALRLANHPGIVQLLATISENEQHYLCGGFSKPGRLTRVYRQRPRKSSVCNNG
jgi:serine/threonine protein kinase